MSDPSPAAQSLFRQEALERVASPERLNVAARIVPASSWLLLLAVAIAIAAAIGTTILIDVPVRIAASGMLVAPASPQGALAAEAAPLTAALYLPLGDGKRIAPGMRVTVEPANVRREDYGSIIGRVTRVSALPVSAEALERRLTNAQLVASVLAAGPRIEVEVALEQDAASPTGYRWTSSHGPNGKLTLLTPCDAQITIERRRLLTLLIPAARRFIGTAE